MGIRYTRKDGLPSAYAFGCGAVHREEFNNGNDRVEIYMEHGVYHVRRFQGAMLTVGSRWWETCEKNKDAWCTYRAYRREARKPPSGLRKWAMELPPLLPPSDLAELL
jgi:hypothetical protein